MFWTDLPFVPQACKLLSDDYEQVRSAAVQMVWVLSQLYPERFTNAYTIHWGSYIFVCSIFCTKERNVLFSPSTSSCSIVPIPSSNEEIRLIDDSFGKICHMVSDGSWVVRVQAAKLLVRCCILLFWVTFWSRIVLYSLDIYFVTRLCCSGLHEAGEPTLPGADTGQEADVRSQGMDTFIVLPWYHFFLCWAVVHSLRYKQIIV